MPHPIVITGIGMVTPLGNDPSQVLCRIKAGESATTIPTNFLPNLVDCPFCAPVQNFQVQPFVSEPKTARLMNRDAQFAVAAARMALRDAKVRVGTEYLAEEIGLFGATGLAGLPIRDIAPLLKASVTSESRLDLSRFGGDGLRAVSPILSFKILANMPMCFVAINEGIKGSNAIYTPWEGQGAQAIETAVRALTNGQARCALAGGCDVKTHELSLLGLQQQGVFDSWRKSGIGTVPGEGAVFLVIEREADATARGARIHARISQMALASRRNNNRAYRQVLSRLDTSGIDTVLCSVTGAGEMLESEALRETLPAATEFLSPKKHSGDLFAAAAFFQLALAAQLEKQTLATCFGHGSEIAAFVLEKS